ncbi:MAG: recombinase family protein, partial [Bacillota bacterium]
VLEAFTRYSQGATIKQLVDWLNEQGVKSASKRPMRIDCVQRMLKNRRYIGEYKYRDIVEPDAIPAIIPKDLFDRVQERLTKNKKAPARFKATEEQYLLTTKLFCGKCGAYMVGESGTSHTGKFHQYYKCVTAKKKQGCKKKTVKKDWIENIVVAETLAMLQDDNVLLYIIDTAMELQARENTSLPHLKQQLAETERSIKNMLDAIQQGIFNSSTKQRLDDLEQTKSDLEVSILQEEMHRPLLTREQVAFFLHRFRDIDITNHEQRQKLIDIFVNAIYLYDDKIVFTFNYKDGTKTITTADIEGSDLCTGGAPQ